MVSKLSIGLILLLLAISPWWAEAGELIQRQGQPDAYRVEPEDIPLKSAQIEAQLKLAELRERIQSPPSEQTYLAVKGIFGEDDQVEHLWLQDLSLQEDRIVGTLDNQPLELSQWSVGDRVVLRREQISDWMAIESGQLVGGWTLRALREQMTEAERAAFDASLEFVIED